MRIKGLQSHAAVGKYFGYKKNTFSSRIRANSIPFKEMLSFCRKEGIPVEEFFYGNKSDSYTVTKTERRIIDRFRKTIKEEPHTIMAVLASLKLGKLIDKVLGNNK